MRKQELTHLHGLLAEVASHLQEEFSIDIDLGEYEDLGTRPTSIHRSPTDHKRSVMSLSNALVEAIEKSRFFSNDSEYYGRLVPRTEDKLLIPEILRNMAEEKPATLVGNTPIFLSFLRNGNATAQRLTVESLHLLYRDHPEEIEKLADRLMMMTEHINERNPRRSLSSLAKRAR